MPSPRRTSAARTIPAVEDYDDRFADNLRTARKQLGVSRMELQRRTGIAWHTIEKIESRRHARALRRRVTIGEAIVLAEALGVQPGTLLRQAVAGD